MSNVKSTAPKPRLLPVIVLMLITTGLFRVNDLWIGFNSTLAQSRDDAGSIVQEEFSTSAGVEGVQSRALSRDSHTAGGVTFALPAESQAEKRLLVGLAERRAVLDLREEEIETREQLLETAEKVIETRLARLAEEAARLEQVQARLNEAQDQEFVSLAKAYERMKPRDAARIFNLLEDDILVPVAAGMRTQSISGVLAEMEPEKARALTRKLANKKEHIRLSEQPVTQ